MTPRDEFIDELLSAYLDGATSPDETARAERLLQSAEHRETLDALVATGCDVFQGFLLGVPAPPARRRFVRTTHFNRYRQPV